jgi:MFS transporter, ACS family, solute carrier family 17 (sodium-dependent inorganic phosphate cotransporter), other
MVIAYTDRVNLAAAAVSMREEFGWTQTQKGWALSAFFVGYMLSLLPSGWLANKYGARRPLGMAVIAWSVCTILTPLAARSSFGALIAVRIAMGIGEAAIFPSILKLYGSWIPPFERSRAVATMASGVPVGTVLGLSVTGWILAYADWSAAFLVFGAVGLAWAIPWFKVVRDDPMADSTLSTPERAFLRKHLSADRSDAAVPWRAMLASRSTWSLFGAQFATTWTTYVLLSWLPSYLRDVQHLSSSGAGLSAALPWLAMAVVSNSAAFVSDGAIRKGLPVTRARHMFQAIGLVGSAALLLTLQNVSSPVVALTVLCAATGTLGLTSCGYAPAYIDLAPRHAAALAGVGTTFATIPGIVGVAVTGWLVQETGTYAAAFGVTAAVSLVGALAFIIFFRADEPKRQ